MQSAKMIAETRNTYRYDTREALAEMIPSSCYASACKPCAPTASATPMCASVAFAAKSATNFGASLPQPPPIAAYEQTPVGELRRALGARHDAYERIHASLESRLAQVDAQRDRHWHNVFNAARAFGSSG